MITATQLRARLTAAYPNTSTMPLDWAIKYARRSRDLEKEYFAAINESHNGEDEAYEKWRNQ
jgi:hypothetical protein